MDFFIIYFSFAIRENMVIKLLDANKKSMLGF